MNRYVHKGRPCGRPPAIDPGFPHHIPVAIQAQIRPSCLSGKISPKKQKAVEKLALISVLLIGEGCQDPFGLQSRPAADPKAGALTLKIPDQRRNLRLIAKLSQTCAGHTFFKNPQRPIRGKRTFSLYKRSQNSVLQFPGSRLFLFAEHGQTSGLF